MFSKIKKALPICFLIIILTAILTACASGPTEPVSNDKIKEDVTAFFKKNISDDISISSISLIELSETDKDEKVSKYNADVAYEYGDISYKRQCTADYSFSRALGWTLESIDYSGRDAWTASTSKLTLEKVSEDLENERYFSGYSDMLYENKRFIKGNIDKQEVDAETGYIRINMTVYLNADYVYEILSIYCEYLLNDDNRFELTTADINLSGVEVQGSVNDDIIKESLKTVNFFREEEDSVWRLSELDKLTYEIVSDNLDKAENSEVVTLSFRGEGIYMYIKGECTLTFHFSSGWYLYDSSVNMESLETGMLFDAWKVNKKLLMEYITEDHTFNFNNVRDFSLEESMVNNLTITDHKYSENGKVQTVYYVYDLIIKKTIFHISGYGKYSLEDNFLSVTTWNEFIDTINFNLTGKWCGYDVDKDYLAYYEMDLVDDGSGIITGDMHIYAVDYKKNPKNIITAELKINGNIFSSISYEFMDEEWIEGDFSLGFIIPRGYYIFTEDRMLCENGRTGEFKFNRRDESELSYDSLLNMVKYGGIKNYIDQMLAKNNNQ